MRPDEGLRVKLVAGEWRGHILIRLVVFNDDKLRSSAQARQMAVKMAGEVCFAELQFLQRFSSVVGLFRRAIG